MSSSQKHSALSSIICQYYLVAAPASWRWNSRKTCWRLRSYNSCNRSTSNLTSFGHGPWIDLFRSISGCSWWFGSLSFVLDCLWDGVSISLAVLSRRIWLLSMSCVTGSRGGVSWYLKKQSVGFGTIRAARAVPSVRDSWMSVTAILLFVLSELPSGRSYHAAFRCISRAPSIFVYAAHQPLSCPPRACEIGDAYLISISAVLGVDAPHRRLLTFQWIGPDCFPRTITLRCYLSNIIHWTFHFLMF